MIQQKEIFAEFFHALPDSLGNFPTLLSKLFAKDLITYNITKSMFFAKILSFISYFLLSLQIYF